MSSDIKFILLSDVSYSSSSYTVLQTVILYNHLTQNVKRRSMIRLHLSYRPRNLRRNTIIFYHKLVQTEQRNLHLCCRAMAMHSKYVKAVLGPYHGVPFSLCWATENPNIQSWSHAPLGPEWITLLPTSTLKPDTKALPHRHTNTNDHHTLRRSMDAILL